MRSLVLLGCAVVLAVLCLAPSSWAAPLVLSTFETTDDFDAWVPQGHYSYCPNPCVDAPATLTRVAAHATDGTYSCQIDLVPNTDYSGMYRETWLPGQNDWSAYNALLFDVENPTTTALPVLLEISDTLHGNAWAKRHDAGFTLTPGVNHLRLWLNAPLLCNDGSTVVDITRIYNFSFSVGPVSAPTTVYFDNLRLDNVQNDPYTDAARNIWKFDCGSWESPVWPDFFQLAFNMNYPQNPTTRPFGWVVPTGEWHNKQANDWFGPDDLARDFVRRCCPTATPMDFQLDLPNGEYRVYLIARGADWNGFPTETWSVTAEGVEALSVSMDSATFYSDSWYYRGLNEDYPLSTSAWERFEEPQFPAYTFSTTVADGHLDLHFDGPVGVFAMIVYPAALESEMAARIAGYEAARREQFEGNYYVNLPASRTFTPTPEETTRGYAAWPGQLMAPCYPDTLPPDPRPALALSTFAAQGETRSVSLAIRPLADVSGVSVTVSDLSDGLGHTIPAAEMEARYLRYLATGDQEFFGAGLLSWKPRLVQDDFPIAIKAQVSKDLWLTVHVPDATPGGTYAGTATVHASSGDLAVPLTVQVYPFALDSSDEQSYGWFYMSPNDRYVFYAFPDMAAQNDVFLRLDFADMKEHGFNGVTFPEPGITWDGSHVTALNTSALETYVNAARDTGFGGQWLGQVGSLGITDKLDRYYGVTEFSAAWETGFKDALGLLVDWMNSPAGEPLVLFLLDEPRESQLNPWNRNFADTMKYVAQSNLVPGITNTVTVMSDSGGTVDYTPFADALDIMQTHPWPNSAGLISRSYAQGKPNWFYNTGGDLRMVYGFYQYKYGRGNGGWEWHFDWLDTGMFDPWPYSPFNNHWRYTYPSPTGPVPTVSYELASQGIWDYRWIATADRLAQQAAASGDPALMDWAAHAQALLTAIKTDTPAYAIDTAYIAQHFAGAASAGEAEVALEAYRRQLADMIASLPAPIPPAEAEVASTSLPSGLLWETSGSGSVAIENLGASPWTVADYSLRASQAINRWGLVSQALVSEVPAGGTASFSLSLTAPPVSTVCYPAGASGSDPPMTDALPLYLGLAHGVDPVPGGTAMGGIVISRFSDDQPGADGGWARPQIEECAGRVPQIVGGYPDGTYGPRIEVTREQMAVFMQRALDLGLTSYEGTFPDVPSSNWAALSIEALARSGIVSGYPGGNYEPLIVVTRDQMAAFVARGMAGSDGAVPPGPGTPTFSDVLNGYWAYKYIEYAVTQHVVGGYPDGKYHPDISVTRDQMAVFIFRAFLQPRPCAVVLAGPAVTAQDPATGGECGWASRPTASASSPGKAYVTFDALRLAPDLAFGGTWEVKFELRNALLPDVPATGSYTWTRPLAPTEMNDAKSAAAAYGFPHWTIAWSVPTGLTPTNYLLVVSVEDAHGNLREVPRKPAFALTP